MVAYWNTKKGEKLLMSEMTREHLITALAITQAKENEIIDELISRGISEKFETVKQKRLKCLRSDSHE
jgi:hypothetical protein